jgi:hypothetical protein
MPDIAAEVAQAVDPSVVVAPFLAQGAMGMAIVVLAFVIWRLWVTLQAAYAAFNILQEKNAELHRALLERVLTGMNTMGGVVSDNTKTIQGIQEFLRSKP